MAKSAEPLRVGRDITIDERKTAVLRKALGCIASVGYENVRLRDVANAAGISVGALQHYFDSREDMLADAFRQASEDLLRGWTDTLAVDLAPWERIVALMDHLVERDALRDRSLVWVNFASAAAHNATIREAFRAIYDRWSDLIRAAVRDGTEAGDFRPRMTEEDLVEVLLQQIDGAILSIASGLDRVDGVRLRSITLGSAAALLDYPFSPSRGGAVR